MIQLGLSKITNFVSPKRSDPPPREIVKLPRHLEQALAETFRWCSLPQPLAHKLRSPNLDPSADLVEGEFPASKDAIPMWVERRYRQYGSAVTQLGKRRSDALKQMGVAASPESDRTQTQGRLLIYFPMETVSCGASNARSHGFFDGEDAPPWDTWFGYSGSSIICWVPGDFISSAQAGIDANPVDCIHWPSSEELFSEELLQLTC